MATFAPVHFPLPLLLFPALTLVAFRLGPRGAALGALIKIGLTNQTSPIYLPDPPFNDHEGLRARAYWSQLFTIIATMPINYLVNKLWTFRAIKDADPAGGE